MNELDFVKENTKICKEIWEQLEPEIKSHFDLHAMLALTAVSIAQLASKHGNDNAAISTLVTYLSVYSKALADSEPGTDYKVLFWRIHEGFDKYIQAAEEAYAAR